MMGFHFFRPALDLRETFLDAQAEYDEVDGQPDADGLTLADLREGTLRSYVEGMSAGTFPRPGTICGRAGTELWWCQVAPDRPTEYVGRLSIRHDLVRALNDRGGQLWFSIRPSRRREGLGSRLLAEALPIVAGHGVTDPIVIAPAGDDAARRTIENVGGVIAWERAGRAAYQLHTAQQAAS